MSSVDLGGGAYMQRVTFCPRCGLERKHLGPFGDCTRCGAPGFISDRHEAVSLRAAWKKQRGGGLRDQLDPYRRRRCE